MKKPTVKSVRGNKVVKMCTDTHSRPVDWTRVRVLQGNKIQPLLDWVIGVKR